MTADVLDRLLTTLSVRLHAFSVCEIQAGWRLCVGASDAVILHYVLAGSGAVRSGSGPWVPFSPRSIIIVPAHRPHDVGEADGAIAEARAERIAARLLTTTDLPIKVVSNSIGYTSRSSFSRAFRTIYGIDPKTFRVIGGPEEREAVRIEPRAAREETLQTNRS